MKIFENNYNPEIIKYKHLKDLGNIICPNCNSKLYVEAKDVYYRDSWNNGILGPGFRGGSTEMFKCPCCEYYVDGANAKKWIETSEGNLIEEEIQYSKFKDNYIEFGCTTMFD